MSRIFTSLKYNNDKFDYDKVMQTLNELVIPNYVDSDDNYINIYDKGFNCDAESMYCNINGFIGETYIAVCWNITKYETFYNTIEIKSSDENEKNKIIKAFDWLELSVNYTK